MRRIAALLVAIAVLAGGVVSIVPARGQADEKDAPIFVDKIPDGYRDWKVISVAHEEGDLNSLGAILGNDVAIKAYREGKLSYPDGTIIAALHWRHAPSEENNKIFGRRQSFVAGVPTNVQFMIKDSKKYASTGGWGFGRGGDWLVDVQTNLLEGRGVDLHVDVRETGHGRQRVLEGHCPGHERDACTGPAG